MGYFVNSALIYFFIDPNTSNTRRDIGLQMEKDPFVFDYRFLSNQRSHRKLKKGFKTSNELPQLTTIAYS